MPRKRKVASDDLYSDLFDVEERRALAAAALQTGVDLELAMMRVLVRKLMREGELEAARRTLEAVGRLVKLKHDLATTEHDASADALGRALDTLAGELGMKL